MTLKGVRIMVWTVYADVLWSSGAATILDRRMSEEKLPVARGRSGRAETRRRARAVTRKLRELGSIGSALLSTGHPYMAHIVPMRRCNLACTYCNEFDDVSKPVDIEEMERRIDDLGRREL